MLDNIPSGKELSELMGENNYNVWEEICKMVDNLYDMEHIWNIYGTYMVRSGNMNINIVEVVKRYAHYMQKKTALVL